MPASTETATPVPCPDPSVHEKAHTHKSLQGQAAGAALYSTRPGGTTDSRDSSYPLGADNKLSSAGAAASLKYARAQDLPSFPVVGIDTKSSGLAAATLANKNKSSPEWWTPTLSADASKAALLAKDYKMAPLWQPEASSASSKAALLAANGPGRDWWQPQASKEGHSAAGIAMRNKGLSPQLDYGYTQEGHRNSMLAARRSVKGVKRSESQPPLRGSYPDAHNASSNALTAATSANASRLGPNSMPREMYTEHPPVEQFDMDEKRHQDALRASAISMAKQMYAIQRIDDDGNITIDHGKAAASVAHNGQSKTSGQNLKSQAMQYITLQEAAQRLAAERIAKITDPNESAAFRDYYGYPSQKRKSRLSVKGRNRARASSEGTEKDSDDERQARKVRSQMNQFNDSLAEVDAKKREKDRHNLMAAAERKVQAQMSKLDDKIFNETGKMSQAMVEDWDVKARARAAAASETRMQNHGKVDIGGGRFLDQSEIDKIAAARIQPTLDQINETAEKQRARDEEIRLDQAERKREGQVEKQRQAELKSEQKRIRSEEKHAEKTKKQAEKQAAKTERHVRKEKKEESNRSSKIEQSSAPKPAETLAPATVIHPVVLHDSNIGTTTERTPSRTSNNGEVQVTPLYIASTTTTSELPRSTSSPKSTEDTDVPASPPKKRFSAILTKLKRKTKQKTDESEKKGFVGGVALTGAVSTAHEDPVPQANAPESSPSISTLSSDEDTSEPIRGRTKSRVSDDSDEFEEARDNFDEGLAPPPTFGSKKSDSPVRDSKFQEAL